MIITEKELRSMILKEVRERLDDDDVFLSLKKDSRQISILLNGMKSKIRFIRPGQLPDGHALKSREFAVLVSNFDKILPLFQKIFKLISVTLNDKEHLQASSSDNEWQIDGNDETIFTDFNVKFDGDNDIIPMKKQFDIMDKELMEAESDINDKIKKTHCSVSFTRSSAERIVVQLSTPWDFSTYNKEIDKCI